MPWARLLKEYAIYAGIMAAILLLLFRDGGVVPLLGGLVAAGPIYLLLGAVMAKFGYQRKTLAELRTPRADSPRTAPASAPAVRTRPAPTRRTTTGPSQRKRRR